VLDDERLSSRRLSSLRVKDWPFRHLQAIIGTVAGVLSIAAAAVTLHEHFGGPRDIGQVVTVVEDVRLERPVSDATIEILTPQNALVTTLTPSAAGRALYAGKEGMYRVLVTHPLFSPEVRQVVVQAGQKAEIHVRLRARAATPVPVSTVARPPERAALKTAVPTPPPSRSADSTLSGFKRIFGH
jgi:hypothetical protein